MGIKDLKEQLNTEIRKKISALFMSAESATMDDIQKAYLAGMRDMFNEMVQASSRLPEHLAEKMLTIFIEVLDDYNS